MGRKPTSKEQYFIPFEDWGLAVIAQLDTGDSLIVPFIGDNASANAEEQLAEWQELRDRGESQYHPNLDREGTIIAATIFDAFVDSEANVYVKMCKARPVGTFADA